MEPAELELLRRNSGLALSREGIFLYAGGAVANERVQALFHRGLSVRDDGEVVLRVGVQWAYVRCESVARFVERLGVTDGLLALHLRGGAVEPCHAPRFGFGPDDRVYVWADESAAPAVFTRGAHHRLVDGLEWGGDGAVVLRVGSATYDVVTLARAPGPASRFEATVGA
jgi:hypothetical protein